jgi:hypothetical protein
VVEAGVFEHQRGRLDPEQRREPALESNRDVTESDRPVPRVEPVPGLSSDTEARVAATGGARAGR